MIGRCSRRRGRRRVRLLYLVGAGLLVALFYLAIIIVCETDFAGREPHHEHKIWSPDLQSRLGRRKMAEERNNYYHYNPIESPLRKSMDDQRIFSADLESYLALWNQLRCSGTDQWRPRGFIAVQQHWTELDIAVESLFDLQCLAPELDLIPVEPSFTALSMNSSPSAAKSWKARKLSEIFDLGLWNHYAIHQCYLPLAHWNEMEHFIPYIYSMVFLDIIQGQHKCNFEEMAKEWMGQFDWFGRTKHICLDLNQKDSVNITELKSALFRHISWEESTIVIVNGWKGVQKYSKNVNSSNFKTSQITMCMEILNDNYTTVSEVLENPLMLMPIQEVWNDASMYIKKYITSENHGRYLAISIHLERILVSGEAEMCFRRILLYVNELRLLTGLWNVFIAVGVDYFGSLRQEPMASNAGQVFMDSLLRNINSDSLPAFERTFENMASNTSRAIRFGSAAYVSTLQKAVLANAECLLMVGGGKFQSHTLHLYSKQRHQHRLQLCYTIMSTSCEVKTDYIYH